MKLKNNTVLITGGSSGLGFELAKRLVEKNNQVIICGRSLIKLQTAKKTIPQLIIFQCDISKRKECERLQNFIKSQYPKCNILVNNAAIVHTINFMEDEESLLKAEAEINTNLLAPILLSKLFIPILESNGNSKLINITTGLVFAPRAIYPFYNATKAALHSFTQVLRIQLKDSCISIIEVLFPAVDTPWHKGNAPDIAISAGNAVNEMISGLEKEKSEIKVGKVKLLQTLSRIAPSLAIRKMNSL